jgi:hypothetical protein
MVKRKNGIKTYDNAQEQTARSTMLDLFKACPIPPEQTLSNLGLFLNSKNLSRLLFMDHLYRQAVDIPGVVMEFGVRWGQNTSLFAALRGIYEPFNRHRTIVGFDTFAGFPSISAQDGRSDMMTKGNLALTENYEQYLDKVLACQEQDNPLAHIKKYELCKGDATVTLKEYLKGHPQTIVSLAYFDFDLYEPTKNCLEAIAPYLTKGSVLGFDELNDPDSPGETVALREVFGLRNISLRRYRHASRVSYFVVE